MSSQSGRGASDRFRAKRMQRFLTLVDGVLAKKGEAHILDVGGTIAYWRALEPLWGGRKLRFTIVNLGAEERDEGVFSVREGNAVSMPHYADNSFDIVHSNSVIEHVGFWREMCGMAAEIRRLAPAYYVQTPNIWFPLEPHFKLPGIQWLPEQMRAVVLRSFKGKYMPVGSDYSRALGLVQQHNLLSGGQMRALFPDARLERERFIGLTKSWIAIREG